MEPGYFSRRLKKPASGVFTASSSRAWSPPRKKPMAALPMTDTHSRMNAKGISSTPVTNSRRVRPREMRARKRDTNGAQAIHQAQKNSVQSDIHCSAG
ncbi:hypothetical protein MILU53160_09560 [Micrococcus luteus]